MRIPNKSNMTSAGLRENVTEQSFLENHIHLFLMAAFILYIFVWSYIAVSKLFAIHAYALDLGVFQQSLFLLLHPVNLNSWILSFFNAPFRLILAPISIFNSFLPIIILQTIFIALPVFPIYGIGKYFLKEKTASLLIATSYLIFYGIAGINWYDVHGQAFFIFFFLTGYYFFLKKKYFLSIMLFTVSGMVRFPYGIFPALFALVILMEEWVARRDPNKNILKENMRFALILLFLQVALLALSFSITSALTGSSFGLFAFAHVSSSPSNYIIGKLVTIPLFLAPFLFLPFYRNKWFLFIIPFYFLVFYADYNWYVYPWILWDQYASGIVPFLYLGTIEGLARFNHKNRKLHVFRHLPLNRLSDNGKVAFTILIVIALMAVVFQPYGPLNSYTDANFYFAEKTDVNITQYNALNDIVNLIPNNDPYVFFQDNIPEVLLRDPSVSTVSYAAGIAGLSFPYNLTYPLLNGTWTNRIDYVIFDYNSRFFYYEGTYPTNLSYYQVVQKLFSTGNYGMMANEFGFVLLKHGYHGPVIYNSPLKVIFPSEALHVQGPFKIGSGNISWKDTYHTVIFATPGVFLTPGNYDLSLNISASNISALNSMLLNVSFSSDKAELGSYLIRGSDFHSTMKEHNVRFTIYIPNFYDSVRISAYSNQWNGTFSIHTVTLLGE